jgi:hypothetical protein
MGAGVDLFRAAPKQALSPQNRHFRPKSDSRLLSLSSGMAPYLYHCSMLVLIGTSLLILFFGPPSTVVKPKSPVACIKES